MKYAFPALVRPEDGVYSVFFPDIQKGGTTGDDIPDALYMANDWLAATLYHMEGNKEVVPEPSDVDTIETEPGDILTLVYADTDDYRKKHDNKAMNRMVTLPRWLNHKAETAGINFSQTLQKALKEELQIAD